jgi:hypothetical protein
MPGSPWPNQPCPHPGCNKLIKDLLAELVPNEEQAKPEFKAVVMQTPGGAITCPYCQRPVEYQSDGKTLSVSTLRPFRFSRTKTEARARDYGSLKGPPVPDMTPEEWIAEEKLMLGALHGYRYAEDPEP